jgi:kynureninase
VPEANRLSEWLKTRDAFTDSRRNEALRLAPFVWNTPDEIGRVFEAVEEALTTGAHLRHAAEAAGPVT